MGKALLVVASAWDYVLPCVPNPGGGAHAGVGWVVLCTRVGWILVWVEIRSQSSVTEGLGGGNHATVEEGEVGRVSTHVVLTGGGLGCCSLGSVVLTNTVSMHLFI